MARPNLRVPMARRWQTIALLVVLAVLTVLKERWSPSSSQPGSELPPSGSGISGTVRLVDGDSFFLGSREVRLEGIDAPEGRQMCTLNGRDWACGEAARRELARLIGGRKITCDAGKLDQHDRLLSRCRVGGVELNRAMVASGMAVSFGRYYNREEAEARAARRGLWAGEFQRPQDWRHAHGIGI